MDLVVEKVRRRAYEIWEASGMQGCDIAHWTAAEREVLAHQSGAAAKAPAKAKRAATPRKATGARKVKSAAAATSHAAH